MRRRMLAKVCAHAMQDITEMVRPAKLVRYAEKGFYLKDVAGTLQDRA